MITVSRLLLLCLALKNVHSWPSTSPHGRYDPDDFVMPDDKVRRTETKKPFQVVKVNGTLHLVVPDHRLGVRHGNDDNNDNGPTNDQTAATPSRPHRETDDDDRVVFPNQSTETQYPDIRTIQVTQCPDNLTYCEKVDNYPVAAIEAIVDQVAHRYPGLFDSELPTELSTRSGDSDEGMAMCDSTIKSIYPKSAMTIDQTWATIVNSEKYRQNVQIEECLNADKPCNYSKNLAKNSTCRQLYRNTKLLTVDSSNSQRVLTFKFPSCCQCRLLN